MLLDDGWHLYAAAAVTANSSILLSPTPPVTVPGKPGDDVAVGTFSSILKQAGLKKWGYQCVRCGHRKSGEQLFCFTFTESSGLRCNLGVTIAETEAQIRGSIEFHLEGMREDGTPIPPPSSQVEYVDVVA